ncbi:MAG: hypothetical protein AB1609_23295 [Bacillota bacterium]
MGEAAGQVRTTTGGGACYGLLAAEIAVDVLTRALAEDIPCAESWAGCDRRWRSLLGREIEVGVRFRQLVRRVEESSGS